MRNVRAKDDGRIAQLERFYPEMWMALVGACAVTGIAWLSYLYVQDSQSHRPFLKYLFDQTEVLVGLLGVILLVASLRLQRAQFQDQSFESVFVELVRLHRDNVNEMELQGSSGRKIFVLITRELREAVRLARRVYSSLGVVHEREMLVAAYLLVFYGSGQNGSARAAAEALRLDLVRFNELDSLLSDKGARDSSQSRGKLGYVPFEGHQSRLGHYYRHLFHAVRFVSEISKQRRYRYVKMLRAQLSTHEQVLLLINALTPMGRRWLEEEHIQTFKLVKNIPRGYFESTFNVAFPVRFKSGYFEWERWA